MKAVLLLIAIAMLVSCSDQNPPPQATRVEQPAVKADQIAEAPKPAEPPPPPPPPPPSEPRHYYSMEEDGEYGYERGISENDEKAGQRATALIMVRYMGEKDDTHTIRTAEGSFSYFSSCKPPCDFVKAKTIYRGELVKTETMRAAEGSVIWAIMQDVQSGRLEPYKPKGKAESE